MKRHTRAVLVDVLDHKVKVRQFCELLHYIKPEQLNAHVLCKIMSTQRHIDILVNH